MLFAINSTHLSSVNFLFMHSHFIKGDNEITMMMGMKNADAILDMVALGPHSLLTGVEEAV